MRTQDARLRTAFLARYPTSLSLPLSSAAASAGPAAPAAAPGRAPSFPSRGCARPTHSAATRSQADAGRLLGRCVRTLSARCRGQSARPGGRARRHAPLGARGDDRTACKHQLDSPGLLVPETASPSDKPAGAPRATVGPFPSRRRRRRRRRRQPKCVRRRDAG
ncbi:hypothetical protein CDD83_8767 [Cordyceps sp. RAO-2017]|nr:hypothetical protein CDD83_8767 [Cordyceps sp. RAO-2017]